MSTGGEARGARLVIEAYGNGRFRIGGAVYSSSVILAPGGANAWELRSLADLSAEGWTRELEPVLAALSSEGGGSILLLGCGQAPLAVPQAVRTRFKAAGVTIEAMDTGAACRTYNVLISEGRLVAAALIAVP
jgi:uncharacterized protein